MAEPAAGLGYVVEQPGPSQHYLQPPTHAAQPSAALYNPSLEQPVLQQTRYIQVPADEYHPLPQ